MHSYVISCYDFPTYLDNSLFLHRFTGMCLCTKTYKHFKYVMLPVTNHVTWLPWTVHCALTAFSLSSVGFYEWNKSDPERETDTEQYIYLVNYGLLFIHNTFSVTEGDSLCLACVCVCDTWQLPGQEKVVEFNEGMFKCTIQYRIVVYLSYLLPVTRLPYTYD